jgi:hypothetical protein
MQTYQKNIGLLVEYYQNLYESKGKYLLYGRLQL